MAVTYPAVCLSHVADMDPERTLVLSVNNRQARRILAALSSMLGASRQVMAIPRIVPFSAWLTQAAHQLSFDASDRVGAHVVDDFGARMIWQTVIAERESEHVLLDVAQAARLSAEADKLLSDWRISVASHEATPDYQRFLSWREGYQQRLTELDADDANRAYERICSAAQDGLLHLPVDNLVLSGFNEISPRMAQLLASLHDRGISICRLEQSHRPAAEPQRIAADDAYAEWQLAAQWARDQLLAHPGKRFAIVAPELESTLALAHRVLHAKLGALGLPFNVAAARPLAAWPLAHAALTWLHLAARVARGQDCPVSELGSALLAGGCTGHDDEAGARALLDAHWRHRGIIALTPGQLASALNRQAPRLGAAWHDCTELARGLEAKASLAGRADQIRQLLKALGFPGMLSVDSDSWQTLEAFDQLIDRLARSASVAGMLTLGQAVGQLARLAHETPFQPQRNPGARLDVLGLLESEGGEWDGVWVLGLTDEVLPAAPRPNPLLPLPALRRFGAPRATPERELQWAQASYAALLQTAPEVWLSHPLQEGERELQPSPCIADLPRYEYQVTADDIAPIPMEYLADDYGPALSGAEAMAGGGIALIDTQARNPLWAFVRFRLGASQLPDYALFADRSVRGQFLHRAMELIYQIVPDKASLQRQCQAAQLVTLVDQACRQAADEWLQDYSPVLLSLELERAHDVVMRWLVIDLQREAFSIKAVEKREQWHHNALQLSVRLDRIDQLADGSLMVIDYKSGRQVQKLAASWTRNRPIELQLPFYASVLAGEPKVTALILARLHASRVDAAGVSDGDCGMAGIAHFSDWPEFGGLSWADILKRWRTAIEALAQEFSGGYAANTFVDANDLLYCDVLPFLRLTEEYAEDVETP